MGLFDKIKEPVILKEGSSATEQVAALQALLPSAPPEVAVKIEQEIKNLNAGIIGENNILFELKNSHMPIFVLQDLYLEYNGLSAQIDFLIITRVRHFIVECKNLFGNIEINSDGDFIRTMSYNGRFHKEGIYSPITQNKRHLELIKEMRSAEKTGIFSKALFEKFFYDNYRSVVVLANPKTVLNAKYAKKEVKNQVIRADQLIRHIQKVNTENDPVKMSENDALELAQYFLSKHKPNPVDYTSKYQDLILAATPVVEAKKEPPKAEVKSAMGSDANQILCPKCGVPMVRRTAKRGEKAGSEFYGCPNFPKCRQVVNCE